MVGKPNQESFFTPPSGMKKRKDVSPLLGAGKSIAPDKRRKKKKWKRLEISDRDLGSEIESDLDKGITQVSETASDSSAARAKRAAKREERAGSCERKEQELEANRPVSPELGKLDLKSLQDLGVEWLDGIDVARRRSSNLKGELSGQIKK